MTADCLCLGLCLSCCSPLRLRATFSISILSSFPPVTLTLVHPSWWGAVCWCYRPLTSTSHRGSVVAGGPANTTAPSGLRVTRGGRNVECGVGNGGAVGEDGILIGRESRRRVFGDELAGIPFQGWIRPSVAPKSFHAYVWSGCWMSSVHAPRPD